MDLCTLPTARWQYIWSLQQIWREYKCSGVDALRHMGGGHLLREEPGSWEMGPRHSGGIDHLVAINQLPPQVLICLIHPKRYLLLRHSLCNFWDCESLRRSIKQLGKGTPLDPFFVVLGKNEAYLFHHVHIWARHLCFNCDGT